MTARNGAIPRAFSELADEGWPAPAPDARITVTDPAVAIAVRAIEAQEAAVLCQCCWHGMRASDVVHCQNSHVFCVKCLERHVAVELSEGRTVIRCIAQGGCSEVLPLATVKQSLSPTVYDHLEAMTSHISAVRAGLRLVFCHVCGTIACPDPGVTVMNCPECTAQTCVDCGTAAHVDMECATAHEEAMTATIVRSCPKCRVPMTKEDGCNKLTCPWCK
jgi:TRIAD3 protein (E3 ubiquitin-protein ligase RNF216)